MSQSAFQKPVQPVKRMHSQKYRPKWQLVMVHGVVGDHGTAHRLFGGQAGIGSSSIMSFSKWHRRSVWSERMTSPVANSVAAFSFPLVNVVD
jgi:hypothetical protein